MTNTEPYSNSDMNRFRDEIASRPEPNPIVEMNFARVQASVDDAFERGWEHHKGYVVKERKEDKRDRLAIWAGAFAFFLVIFGIFAVLDAYMPAPDPSTVPHISAE